MLAVTTAEDKLSSSDTLERLSSIVAARTAECCRDAFGDRLRATILSGSMARNESTLITECDPWQVLGDADFFLIFRDGPSLPLDPEIEAVTRRVEHVLLEAGIRCHISLGAVTPGYLRKLAPCIESYELRTRGRIIWGDNVFSLVPPFTAADIPLEDGWRMLTNRMVETLQALLACHGMPSHRAEPLRYAVIKLYLDMATSYLLFAGRYCPGYRERCEALQAWAAERDGSSGTPFSISEFSRRVAACTSYKLGRKPGFEAESGFAEDAFKLCCAAAKDARSLWCWELRRLLNATAEASDDDLMRQWMARQTCRQKVRGWASLGRRTGWWRSWRQWPGWGGRARRSTPRYWIYRAAARVFFDLAGWVVSDDGLWQHNYAVRLNPSWLPGSACGSAPDAPCTWAEAARAVVSDYNRFLMGTRA